MTSGFHGFRFVLIACAVALAAGCKGGGGDGSGTTSPATASGADGAPTISGTATTSAKANGAYSFTPVASDANGDKLSFQIQNKPSWATFNTVTGQLTGKPGVAQIGTYANIVISASDGGHTAALPPFTITVSGASGTGVTVSWTAPTENVDGTALTDLGGFTLAYGASKDALTKTVQIDNPSIDTYVLEDLAPGTYYFGVKAYSASGAESAMSTLVSKVID
jgi:hypothetical protein